MKALVLNCTLKASPETSTRRPCAPSRSATSTAGRSTP